MKPVFKGALIATGYAAAILIAASAVGIRTAATDGPDAQASSGMFAFGDTLLYVAVFGGAALFVLRILVAPLLVFAFIVSALLSPYRYPRFAFVGPTLMEGAVSAYGALVWFLPWLSYKP